MLVYSGFRAFFYAHLIQYCSEFSMGYSRYVNSNNNDVHNCPSSFFIVQIFFLHHARRRSLKATGPIFWPYERFTSKNIAGSASLAEVRGPMSTVLPPRSPKSSATIL